MNTETTTNISLDRLVQLPSYAEYLLVNRLDDYIEGQIEFSYELDIPLLKFFKHLPKEELRFLARGTTTEFLNYLKENKAAEFIRVSLERWQTNQLPVVDKDNIVAEDITLVSYLRRKLLFKFLTDYTRDPEEMMELIAEIDLFVTQNETASGNLYINLLRERIDQHSHLIERVNNTIPGAVHVFDIAAFKNIYSNQKLPEIIGYTATELNEQGPESIRQLMHPEDQEKFLQHLEELKQAGDGEVKVLKYRLKNKAGKYVWLTSFESVFRRNENGAAIQTIGITLDTSVEAKAISDLQQSDERYRQAEAITHMGNYVWYLDTNKLKWSEELYRIYGFAPGIPIDYQKVQKVNHPDDTPLVVAATKEAISRTGRFDFHYRITVENGKEKILHARGEVIYDARKQPAKVLGTVQDVTEKQLLIKTLRRSEILYRQAEELANMGTWNWNLKTRRLEWTDQLYKIYGLEPQSEEVTIDKFLSWVYPEDRDEVQKGIQLLETEDHVDYTFRILSKDGKTKWLRSIGHVHRDENGERDSVIGTERDVTEKQTLIHQLRESEYLYKQAQAIAHIGNWTLEIASMKFDWSDEMYKIYEVEKGEEPTVEKWRAFIHPDERAEVTAYFDDCIREGKNYDKTHRILLPGGKIKVLHRKGEYTYNKDGQATRMIGTTQDVTEQFRIQQELKENQTFIRKITDATPSIIASYNINTGKYVFISEGLQKLLGYSSEDVMGQGVQFFASIIHQDDAEQVMEKNTKVLAEANLDPEKNDLVAEFTYRMRHKNGEYRWFHTYGTIFDRNKDGQVEHVLNISLDITEQAQAAEKIKEQEHFIQQIADASPTILYLFDVEKQSMVYINREIFFVLGYAPEEIIAESSNVTDALYHSEDYSLLPERLQSNKTFQRVDSMIQYECRLKHKDETWRWFLVREIVFKTDENGKITQILGAALDISRRKDMEKTILQNTLQLEQSNASLEEFAYVASHDLKEPLRKISTFGDRLVASQQNNLTADGKIYLKKIVDASQRMQTMISDLLSISMISGNRSFERHSLQNVLDEVMQTLEYKIEQQNAVIRYEQLPEASIIPSQFRQLFQNLLSNSLKFVKEGVQPIISITCSVPNDDEVKNYGLRGSSGFYKISFSDNGIGFENEFAGKIFAIFQRLHGRSEYEGSGIGLAICKKIVEHHGGVIYASAVPGEGATFTVIIPA